MTGILAPGEKKNEMHKKKNESARSVGTPEQGPTAQRKPYERPTLTKKRSVSRVTLFSGGGVVAGGLTATG